ncbi:hypothetical protein [Phytohabitans rumicis]|uniref:ABC transmembrane type-1 domain-containing protein n=1 Tax=Phytohabitans rumicis TaxID=1076125 RepID=A0A6V8KP81_9ACTN|nr:hypothetical protein [Phytohabitans rumicis]GFJ86972.1 hypothetical protein Prum_006140 [Phytohabitans rumicis]
MNIVQLVLDWFTDPSQWSGPDGIPNRVAEHLYYSGLALLIAAGIALPLGLLIGHTGRAGFLVVNSGNAARALPTLGLVGLAVVVFGIGLVPTLVPWSRWRSRRSWSTRTRESGRSTRSCATRRKASA